VRGPAPSVRPSPRQRGPSHRTGRGRRWCHQPRRARTPGAPTRPTARPFHTMLLGYPAQLGERVLLVVAVQHHQHALDHIDGGMGLQRLPQLLRFRAQLQPETELGKMINRPGAHPLTNGSFRRGELLHPVPHWPPRGPGLGGRPTSIRPGGLQAAQRRRASLRQAPRHPSRGHPLREFVYKGTIDVATIRIWLRDPTLNHPHGTRPNQGPGQDPGTATAVAVGAPGRASAGSAADPVPGQESVWDREEKPWHILLQLAMRLPDPPADAPLNDGGHSRIHLPRLLTPGEPRRQVDDHRSAPTVTDNRWTLPR